MNSVQKVRDALGQRFLQVADTRGDDLPSGGLMNDFTYFSFVTENLNGLVKGSLAT